MQQHHQHCHHHHRHKSQYKATPREWPTPWHRCWSLQLIYGNLEQFHRLLQLPDVWYTIAFQQAGNNATVGKVLQRSSFCCWGNAVGTRITEISITAVLTNSIPVVIVDHSTITHIGENSTVWKCLIMRYTDISRSSSSSSWKNWFKWHNVIMSQWRRHSRWVGCVRTRCEEYVRPIVKQYKVTKSVMGLRSRITCFMFLKSMF